MNDDTQDPNAAVDPNASTDTTLNQGTGDVVSDAPLASDDSTPAPAPEVPVAPEGEEIAGQETPAPEAGETAPAATEEENGTDNSGMPNAA